MNVPILVEQEKQKTKIIKNVVKSKKQIFLLKFPVSSNLTRVNRPMYINISYFSYY